MAGVSTGGMGAFNGTVNHVDPFLYLGGFSGAAEVFGLGSDKRDMKTAFNGVMDDPAAFAKRVHVLWIGVGTNEPERMKQGSEKLHASLDETKNSAVQSADLPLGDGTVRVENARHGPRAGERIFRQSGFVHFKSQARFVRQRETAVLHPHSGEAEPFFPDLILRGWRDTAADFLDK